MKKFIVFAVVLALLVPSLALAKAEFSLGGYVKLDAFWDSDNQVGKNLNGAPLRNNDPNAKHGRLRFTSQSSRFNFTIKGPNLWGATTTGFIEIDFDSATERPLMGTGFTASQSYIPRMRHAMFRFNWPTSELMLGQYFSMFSEWYAESAEDGPLQATGTPTARMAQIRFTQTFMQDWTVAALIGDPQQVNYGNTPVYNANQTNGELAETPMVQGKIKYAHDFWGKAAYYGKPIPFTVQFTGGWQRGAIRTGNLTAQAFGEQGYTAGANIRVKNQNLNPWMFMGSLFIPVIPTHSANLAGTASILTQWWIGQGVEAFGFTGVASNKYRFDRFDGFTGVFNYDSELLNKFGGFVEGQYYFTNQWFLNALYAFSKVYSVSRANAQFGLLPPGAQINGGLGGKEMAFSGDNASTIQQINATLWYRPIQAIKFGLQYSYMAASYLQANTTPNNTPNTSRFGDDHRVEFVGFFYF